MKTEREIRQAIEEIRECRPASPSRPEPASVNVSDGELLGTLDRDGPTTARDLARDLCVHPVVIHNRLMRLYALDGLVDLVHEGPGAPTARLWAISSEGSR